MGDIPLTAFDLAVLVVVGLSAIVALARGLVLELFGVAAWIAAAVVAWIAFPHLKPILRDAIGNDIISDLATAAIAFLVPLIAMRLLGNAVAKAVSSGGLGAIDRILGLVFGLARGAFLVCLAYFLGSILVLPDRQPSWVKQAYSLPYVQAGTRFLHNNLPASLEERVRAAMNPGAPAAAGEKGYSDQERRALEQLLPGGGAGGTNR